MLSRWEFKNEALNRNWTNVNSTESWHTQRNKAISLKSSNNRLKKKAEDTKYQQAQIAAEDKGDNLHHLELGTTCLFGLTSYTTFTRLSTIEHKGSLWLHKQTVKHRQHGETGGENLLHTLGCWVVFTKPGIAKPSRRSNGKHGFWKT